MPAITTFIQQEFECEKPQYLMLSQTKVKPLKPDLSDLVVISQLATEQQQQNTAIRGSSKQIKEIAIDVG